MAIHRLGSPRSIQTTFLIPSIHCPTCASFLESFLFALRPRPIEVETSILSHSVTVKHPTSLSSRSIARALGEAGYEVDTIFRGASSEEINPSDPHGSSDDDFPFQWISHLGRWLLWGHKVSDDKARRKRHAEHCEQCRKDDEVKQSEDGHTRSPTPGEESLVVVESGPSKTFRASISIVGMTCSSCVGKIATTLREIPWVQSADVALITQNATVVYEGEHNAEELAEAIEDIGYDASIAQVEEISISPKSRPGDDLWSTSLSITGMTCASCVGSITSVLEKLPYVKEVNVNLVTGNAIVVVDGKSHVDDVVNTVDDIGFSATVNETTKLGEEVIETTERVVMIRVEGTYCQHCPGRVTEALNSFDGRVTIEKPLTSKDPIIKISYSPSAPDFTIRHILAAISAIDTAFRPTIYHPPTVEERARQMHRRIRQRILYRVLLSITIAIPSFIIGIVYMALLPTSNPGRQYLMQHLKGVTRAEWSLLVMATPVYFFAADIFHRRAIKELYSLWRPGSPAPLLRRFYKFGSMDMLMSFGTSIAYFSSIAELIIAATQLDGEQMQENTTYFDSVVFLTMFLLIGRLLEAYSKAKTGEAVSELGNLRPKEALLLTSTDGDEETYEKVNVDMVETGDVVRVVHGASPPWDGYLLSDKAEFSEASLTGESRPVKKTTGDQVFSGTMNEGGPISMRITGASGNSMLDQIIKVVREGQARRAPIERVADALTSYFVPVVTLIAISTWLIWLGLGLSGRLPQSYLDTPVGGWPFWSLQFAIAVFIIACPCGIGLAAPTALFVGGGLAAKHGILAKGGGEAFQEASNIDIIVFDKTGTLTEGGEPKLTDHEFLFSESDDWTESKILDCLKEIESNSSHPIARAIVSFCEDRGIKGIKALGIEEVPGKGMKASFDLGSSLGTVEILVGNETLMNDNAVLITPEASKMLDSWKDQAKSVVLVAGKSISSSTNSSWKLLGIFATSDPLRPEARPVLDALRRQGKDIWMLSGDNSKTANAVGALVGIDPDHIIAGVLPEQKADKISYLQKSQAKTSSGFLGLGSKSINQRAVVAMVGDGVNDSPALTVADVGIAIGSGSDVAISAAEFVLVNPNLNTLLVLTSLSRAVFKRVKFNFAWALVYNIVELPIAAGVLYPLVVNGKHTRLDPVWASLAMALSSVSVICSSLLLKSRLPVVGFKGDRILGADG
ncbi:heavy metal translocatin [Annulohypoxylon maeteangense]|uniref:heavy metal translocatin n=1 Tax=Annulohypoxylon maeteangense TaxID=1927788 RepID=UPI0020082EDA|nr:heavy metal translocatin [Annulohypoxylon maeteangense]KAI0884761.1 heavy metal translocatin [Annulohypoxylon maeteangense]